MNLSCGLKVVLKLVKFAQAFSRCYPEVLGLLPVCLFTCFPFSSSLHCPADKLGCIYISSIPAMRDRKIEG